MPRCWCAEVLVCRGATEVLLRLPLPPERLLRPAAREPASLGPLLLDGGGREGGGGPPAAADEPAVLYAGPEGGNEGGGEPEGGATLRGGLDLSSLYSMRPSGIM